MRPTLWAAVKRIFGDAMERPPAEREAFVESACAGDAAVRDEVMRLVRRRERSARLFRAVGPAPQAPAASCSAGPGAAAHGGTETRAAGDVRAAAALPLAPGAVLAGRYELGAKLGAGGFGAVHLARDRVAGRDVAVKLIPFGPHDRAIRHEIAVLRLARLPGLVELLDEGAEGGHAFLVMRLVRGAEFPGFDGAGPAPWAAVAPGALALVDALARLHWLGLVHGDLKPANVLVESGGAVTIVDLGIARDADAVVDPHAGTVAGTLAYLAPERFDRAPASVAADLYAVGVILWEALSGRPLRDARTLPEYAARSREPAPPLASAAAGVPPAVAAAVDAMLDRDPARRPRSARVAAAMLRGEGADGARVRLPFVGSDAAVAAVVDAVRRGRPLDLAGPLGCGRSRTLAEAERRLSAEGYRVLRAHASPDAFRSLAAAVGEPPDGAAAGLAGVREWFARTLRARLDVRVCLMADDWESLDPHSRDVIESVRASGPVVRALGEPAPPDAVVPAPRTEEDLRAVFRGPDRLLHLREDGARELWRRTRGVPGDVVREIEAWAEGGVARIEDGLVVLDRAGVERLEARLSLSMPSADVRAAGLAPAALDVQAVLEIAGCPVTAACVAAALDVPAWRVEAAIEDLAARRLARRGDAGEVEAVRSADAAAGWAAERRRRVHGVLARALPAATERRLYHVQSAGDDAEVLLEALAHGRALLRAARHSAAAALACRVLVGSAATAPDGRRAVEELAGLLADATLALGDRGSVADCLSTLSRVPAASALLDDEAATMRGADAVLRGDARWALDRLSGPAKIADPGAARRRAAVQALAARMGDDAAHAAATRDLVRWCRMGVHRDAAALAFSWFGWLCYRRRQYARAARHHLRAAERRGDPIGKIVALTSAASAALEAGDLASAERHAARAAEMAAVVRAPLAEARAEWLRRAAAYRSGRDCAPDAALAEAALALGDGGMRASILLNEAAIAWRRGEHRVAAAWAGLAADGFGAAGRGPERLLARALAAACGDAARAPSEDEVAAALRDARLPAVVLQAAALTASAVPGFAVPATAVAVSGAAPTDFESRREVLSPAECHRLLGNPATGGRHTEA